MEHELDRRPLEHELDAARIVGAITGFGWRALDPGGGRVQLADFELLDGLDMRVGLLEVTATVPEAVAAFRGAVRSKIWSFPELREWPGSTEVAVDQLDRCR